MVNLLSKHFFSHFCNLRSQHIGGIVSYSLLFSSLSLSCPFSMDAWDALMMADRSKTASIALVLYNYKDFFSLPHHFIILSRNVLDDILKRGNGGEENEDLHLLIPFERRNRKKHRQRN
jgi:hypothetical protein